MNSELSVHDTLSLARDVAGFAQSLGVQPISNVPRRFPDHLGAVMADAILQAGLNYRTVVKARVQRIISEYPDAATLRGTMEFVRRDCVSELLLWNHAQKIDRFKSLAYAMERHEIQDTLTLKEWLQSSHSRVALLEISGIGPKTVDYMCCLVGLDSIAVDRHVRTFAKLAGMHIDDYQSIKIVMSYAADLLNISRRDFDAWVWNLISRQARSISQPYLF